MAQSKNAEVRSRSQTVREFLSGQALQAWLASRPDERLMMTGHTPYGGVSALLCFTDQEPVLLDIEPRDYVPADSEGQSSGGNWPASFPRRAFRWRSARFDGGDCDSPSSREFTFPKYGGGARIEDDVLLTESGHEVLSQDWRGPERVPQR